MDADSLLERRSIEKKNGKGQTQKEVVSLSHHVRFRHDTFT